MADLKALRIEIDAIDKEMAELFARRIDVAKKVALYKQENNMPIFDKAREVQVIEGMLEAYPHKDQEFRDHLKVFFETMMGLSKETQQRLISSEWSVGYQGVPGSFSHEALEAFFGAKIHMKNYLTFEDVFKAISSGEIRYGVMAVENSSTGIVNEAYDLMSKYGLYIIREGMVKIEQNLLGTPGTTLDDITDVYSHAQGFSQSSEYFNLHKEWNLVPYHNTAKSAEYISELEDKSKACVASKKAAEIYGLEVIEENIQNSSKNFTRFVVLSRNMEIPKEANKISLYLTTAHRPGSLFTVLEVIADNGLNMLKIESRPLPGRVWEYSFFIDLEGNIEDPGMAEVLKEVRKSCLEWKLLGNYIKA